MPFPGKWPSRGKRKNDDKDKTAPKSKKRKVIAAPLPVHVNPTIINVDDDEELLPQGQARTGSESLPTTTVTAAGSISTVLPPLSSPPSSSEDSASLTRPAATVSASSVEPLEAPVTSSRLVTPPLEQPSPVVSSHVSGPYAEYVTGPSESSEREETIVATSKEAEENTAAISGDRLTSSYRLSCASSFRSDPFCRELEHLGPINDA